MSVDKTTDSADPGASSDFTVTVTNDGNGEDTVSYMTMGAQAWTPSLSEMSSTIASGQTGQVVFTLTVPADSSAEAKSGTAMVHAYSEACGDDTQVVIMKQRYQLNYLQIKFSILVLDTITTLLWQQLLFKKEWHCN